MKKQKLKALFYPDVPFESLFIPYIYKEIYFDGIYNNVFRDNREMVVVDVGANIGVVTQYMRDYCKKLYAIEPSNEHFTALKKNKEFNEWDNVEVFKAAIADKDGEMTLFNNDKNRTCHSLTQDYTSQGFGTEKVKTYAMDTFFKENKIKKCDFMKFDVEGAEDLILRSESFKRAAPKITSIMVEFHHPTWMELVRYMETLGYTANRYESSAIIVLFSR